MHKYLATMVDGLQRLKTQMYLNLLGFEEVLQNLVGKIAAEPPPLVHRLHGCKVLITGGNAGVGRATAEELVRRGADVVLACRNISAAEAAASELRQLAPSNDSNDGQLGSVEVAELDLASLASVRKLTSLFIAQKRVFTWIICNAGIMTPPTRLETEDGLEQQFQVHFFKHYFDSVFIHLFISHRLSK